MDERMRLAAMTHVSHLNAAIALWRDVSGWSARIDHASGWRQTVKPIAPAGQALYHLVGPDAGESVGPPAHRHTARRAPHEQPIA